jgi:hypothetical protein
LRCPTFVARHTRHALQIVRTVELLAASLDFVYRPWRWSEAGWQRTSELTRGWAEIDPACR